MKELDWTKGPQSAIFLPSEARKKQYIFSHTPLGPVQGAGGAGVPEKISTPPMEEINSTPSPSPDILHKFKTFVR